MLPVVNFADKKDHEVWIDLKEQTGKEMTGWSLHVHILFSCDINTLKTEEEVLLLWDNTIWTEQTEKNEKSSNCERKVASLARS